MLNIGKSMFTFWQNSILESVFPKKMQTQTSLLSLEKTDSLKNGFILIPFF